MIAIVALSLLMLSLLGWKKLRRRQKVVARLNKRLPAVRETSIESIIKSDAKSGR